MQLAFSVGIVYKLLTYYLLQKGKQIIIGNTDYLFSTLKLDLKLPLFYSGIARLIVQFNLCVHPNHLLGM